MTDAKLDGLAERATTIAGTRIRFYAGGAGDPVLLVHGFAGAASNWVEIAPELARTHRVLVPDLPGHGRSAPLPGAPTAAAYADSVAAIAEREGLWPAHVVGHSFGGLLALRLAVDRPGVFGDSCSSRAPALPRRPASPSCS